MVSCWFCWCTVLLLVFFAENVESQLEEKPPKVHILDIQRSLVGDGAHRTLLSVLTLDIAVEEHSKFIAKCELDFLECLPEVFFADPFQLQRLQQLGVIEHAHVFGDVDLEKRAISSSKSTVELRKKIPYVAGRETLKLKVSLPLHARYPPTNLNGYFSSNITMPKISLYCGEDSDNKIKPLDDADTSVSELPRIHVEWKEPALSKSLQGIEWCIPAGNPQYLDLVEKLTTYTATVGVMVLFLVSWQAYHKSSLVQG